MNKTNIVLIIWQSIFLQLSSYTWWNFRKLRMKKNNTFFSPKIFHMYLHKADNLFLVLENLRWEHKTCFVSFSFLCNKAVFLFKKKKQKNHTHSKTKIKKAHHIKKPHQNKFLYSTNFIHNHTCLSYIATYFTCSWSSARVFRTWVLNAAAVLLHKSHCRHTSGAWGSFSLFLPATGYKGHVPNLNYSQNWCSRVNSSIYRFL